MHLRIEVQLHPNYSPDLSRADHNICLSLEIYTQAKRFIPTRIRLRISSGSLSTSSVSILFFIVVE